MGGKLRLPMAGLSAAGAGWYIWAKAR